MWSQVLVNKCTLISDRHLIISEWEHLYKAEVMAVLVWTFRCGCLSKFTPRADRTCITEQVLFAKLHLNKPKTLMSVMHSIKSNTYHIKHGGGKWMMCSQTTCSHRINHKLLSLPKYFIVKVTCLTAWMKFFHVTGQWQYQFNGNFHTVSQWNSVARPSESRV